MNWLTDFVRPKIKKTAPIEIADNLWEKCPECGQMLFSKELKKACMSAPVAAITCVCMFIKD